MLKKIGIVCASILVSLAAGGIGSLATMPNIPTWYAELAKPLLNPPNWVFGPVWTVLYILMGISLALVILKSGKNKKRAYVWFAVQLALNTIWSLIFFGLQQPWLGVLIIITLLVSIVMTMRQFSNVSPPAMWLLVPYIAWVSFASYLTIGIAVLNG